MEFLKLSDQEKRVLLDFLGYAVSKEGIVLSKGNNKPHICPYTGEPVRFKDASVMPGSTVIFNTSVLALAEYFSEHVENKEDSDNECQRKPVDSM